MNGLGAGNAASPHGLWPAGSETFACDHDAHCITCSDEAVPLRVVEVDRAEGLAIGADGSTIETALVEPVERGDVLLVHAGTALARAT